MFDFYQKRKLRSIATSRPVQAALLVTALVIGWSAYNRYEIAAEMADRRALVEQQAAALEARKATLEEQVQYLSDERGIEAEMRRQFDVALEGERVVVIVEPEAEVEIQPLSTSTKSETPWYQFWR